MRSETWFNLHWHILVCDMLGALFVNVLLYHLGAYVVWRGLVEKRIPNIFDTNSYTSGTTPN